MNTILNVFYLMQTCFVHVIIVRTLKRKGEYRNECLQYISFKLI